MFICGSGNGWLRTKINISYEKKGLKGRRMKTKKNSVEGNNKSAREICIITAAFYHISHSKILIQILAK